MAEPIPVKKKKRKRRSDCTYQTRYANQLIDGLRRDGLSVEEVAQLWGITAKRYYKWVLAYPEFAEAHEYGVRDNMVWWQKLGRRGIAGEFKLNAAAYNFTMSNLHGWNTKVVTDNDSHDEIRTININVLPSREQNALENKPVVIDVDAEKEET